MRRLVDSTYLGSVFRCMEGNASSLEDVETFLRFIGELLISEGILFTADETGPVYRPLSEIASRLNSLCRENFVRHFGYQSVKYRTICLRAARTLSTEIQFLKAERLDATHYSFEPPFSPRERNPDELILNIIDDIRAGRPIAAPRLLKPATATQFVLSQDYAAKALREKMMEGLELNRNAGLAFAAAVRMLIYSHMSADLQVDYLPATGRARLHSLTAQTEHFLAGRLLAAIKPNSPVPTEPPLIRVINALVALSQGSPTEIIKQAIDLRKKTPDARPFFMEGLPQDSCLAHEARISRELKEAIEIQTGKTNLPSLIEALEPRIFVIGGIPSVLIKIDKLGRWIQYKHRKRQTSIVADLFVRTKRIDAALCFERLIYNSGVRA